MPLLTKVANWKSIFRRRRIEKDLNDELSAYVDELTERKIEAGLDANIARQAALQEIGSLEAIKDQIRRQGIRPSRVRVAGAIACAITLSFAVGVAVSSDVLRWIDPLIISALPLRAPQEPAQSPARVPISYPEFGPDNPPPWVGIWHFQIPYSDPGTLRETLTIRAVPNGIQLTRDALDLNRKRIYEDYTAAYVGKPIAFGNPIRATIKIQSRGGDVHQLIVVDRNTLMFARKCGNPECNRWRTTDTYFKDNTNGWR